MLLTASVIHRLDARDRALFHRCAFLTTSSRASRWFWLLLTHTGGATCTIAFATIPLLVGGPLVSAARHALATLVLSHLLVQMVKRTVVRPRPTHSAAIESLIAAPDRFAFPSGHSAAAMSVAIAYAMAYPALAVPLLIVATLVGMSRVFLGVHYPGDVLVGQVLALLVYAVMSARF